jgi:hypothetical protein
VGTQEPLSAFLVILLHLIPLSSDGGRWYRFWLVGLFRVSTSLLRYAEVLGAKGFPGMARYLGGTGVGRFGSVAAKPVRGPPTYLSWDGANPRTLGGDPRTLGGDPMTPFRAVSVFVAPGAL